MRRIDELGICTRNRVQIFGKDDVKKSLTNLRCCGSIVRV